MNDCYKGFLRRLVQYRIRLNMTQEMISKELGITQSQLSKQELGKTVVPYKTLANFVKMGWDVDYLLIGKKSQYKVSELSEMLKSIDKLYRKSMLELITWILDIGIKKSFIDLSMEEKCEICILKMKCNGDTNGSVLYNIRKIVGEAQITMAEKLGVNIKKYRALEKCQIDPDAELLLEIYQIAGCKPSLFFMNERIENVIIDDLWGRIDSEKRGEILSIILQISQFVDGK